MFYTPEKIVVRQYGQAKGRILGNQEKRVFSKLLNDCKGLARLTSRGSKTEPKKEFFGDYATTKSSEIDNRFRKIYQFLDGIDKFTFVSSNDEPDSIASFPMKAEHKVEGGMCK